MSKVEISTPGKLMLFGEHSVVYGHPCIVTAVDQRMNVVAEIQENSNLQIIAPEVGLSSYSQDINNLGKNPNIPKGARFVETAVRNFFEKFNMRSGLRIETKSDFSSEFGFGSSSAVTVGVVKVLSELFDVKLKEQELFDLSYKTVLDVQGVGSGFDLAAAIWGGTLWFVGGGKTIIPLGRSSLPIVVGYTGIKADTPTLIRRVEDEKRKYPKIIGKIFEAITLITEEAKDVLERRDWTRLGELMNLNQGLLDSLGVNTRELSSLIYAAREAGAFGAKLSGAGGGDCMIALVDSQTRGAVERMIDKAGGKVLQVKTGAEGIKK